MPATDHYRWNQKTLHIVFAVSSLALLTAVILMMYQDQADEWRDYQRKNFALETAVNEQSLQALETDAWQKEVDALHSQLKDAEAKLAEAQKDPVVAQLFADLDAQQREVAAIETQLKAHNSNRDEARSDEALASNRGASKAELERLMTVFHERQAKCDETQRELDAARAQLSETTKAVVEYTKQRDQLQADYDKATAEANRVQATLDKIHPTRLDSRFKRWMMEQPVVDGFNSHLKIVQDWLPGLQQKLGMTEIARFDRCRSCHLGIDRVEAGNLPSFPLKSGPHEAGYDHPFATHPNPDLFLSASSPHPTAKFGCTICHEGQGSGTSFTDASHTPNTPAINAKWEKDHHFHANHFWEYPMYPERFREASCVKCHHNVVELGNSPKFGSSAPKVVEGYNIIRQFGCFGCHEINGFDGAKSIGPDLRLEPNYSAAAQSIQADPGFEKLDAETQMWTEVLAQQPYRDDLRHNLRTILLSDAKSDQPTLGGESHRMADVLQDVEIPGEYRKVGPSLRYIGHKVSTAFLYDWVRLPTEFRPSTKMPQFFGLVDHITDSDERATVERYEPLEILSIAKYLEDRTNPFDYIPFEEGVAESSADESRERGKVAFETRGCLNCHTHRDFPKAASNFGPDLSNIGDKFKDGVGAPNGRAWMYGWIKQPTHYNSRTKMPDLFLDPIKDTDGNVIDPAADIVEYLLGSTSDWQPSARASKGYVLSNSELDTLDELVLMSLKKTFTSREAESYLDNGIPVAIGPSLKGAEIELVGDISLDKKMLYLGRKAIGRHGCYACHDIPGFESAKPIGTGLADWGRKETSKLAFEHIMEYLHNDAHHGGAHHGNATAAADGHESETHSDAAVGVSHLPPADRAAAEGDSFDESYYVQKLQGHEREGFIWQKLKEPRSYDYQKIVEYNDRLRMPKFNLTPQEREAIVTFVLGLVADPPADQFVYHGDERQQALVAGRRVLEQYNCKGCHLLKPEKWVLEFEPGLFPEPPSQEGKEFPFLLHPFPAAEVQASGTPDPQRGVVSATIVGLPSISNRDGSQEIWDEEGDPVEEDVEYDPQTLQYPFDLWENTLLNGKQFDVGVLTVTVPASNIKKQYAADGGDLTRLLLPRVIELEKESNPNANGKEAWGWLPPPLHNEGSKVQPGWLHSFLLNPYKIRPATFLRMPRFNMSPDDATKLVNYFAAVNNAEFPFELNTRTQQGYLAYAEQQFEKQAGHDDRLGQAMSIVTNSNYCVKCHLVGDFRPEGTDRALAPNLAQVQQRLRPEFTRDWIANPKRVLPYTNMPVNIAYDASAENFGGIATAIFPGTSVEQLNGLVDLLMNYSHFTASRTKISPLVQQAAAAAAAAGQDAASEPEAVENGESEADDTTSVERSSDNQVSLRLQESERASGQ
ncbi:MAG: hypothetical protein KDA85_02545 [Planctomycetaceae bacterium]|nr:hypothetical protein [Planctomycetaceae bacterium]